MPIYLAGHFTMSHPQMGSPTSTFVLISQVRLLRRTNLSLQHGVPGIIYWRGGEAITSYLTIAPAQQVHTTHALFKNIINSE